MSVFESGAFNSMTQKCPWCGNSHDDGALIKTGLSGEEHVYVCLDCADEYEDGNEGKLLNWRIQRLRERILERVREAERESVTAVTCPE